MTTLRLDGSYEGLTLLDRPPSLRTAPDSALYQELWSKLRWAVGNTLLKPYPKRSPVGEIARRFALIILRNQEEGLV